MTQLDVVVCSTSGKPVLRHKVSTCKVGRPPEEDDAATSSFASSLQGLLSFVACTQHEELLELEAEGCRGVFRSSDSLTFAAIERGHVEDDSVRHSETSAFAPECLRHLLHLLQNQILFVLSDRGLDVLRRQPGYDLRELLNGTERVTRSLTELWASTPTLRFRDCGVPFVRLRPERRRQVTRALEFEAHKENAAASAMICGLLLAKEQVVAIAQPAKKQFSMLVDDLLLLVNFVYHTPSLAKSETWTPICLTNFNARGFLYAYVVFLTSDVCLLLLSSQQSPEQFPHFQATKVFVAQRLEEIGAMEDISASIKNHAAWQPHGDLPLLHHFIYKNELTGECARPELVFPFDEEDFGTRVQLLNQYAKLQHLMFPAPAEAESRESQVLGKRLSTLQEATAARMAYERSDSGLFVGMCSADYRLYVWFDSLATISDAREQMQVLLDRLRHDEELMSVALFLSGGGFPSVSSLGMWP
ncbi:Vacuolar fusion protein MON1-like protein A [Phytophthora ramorum]|uniref:Vacuolar fusion protein MON1-like protein A n=1 Tax=Phytophthora ramorum TaxID=164328 RepID=UPI0030A013A5|nr:Vacuolar fusion protein MON1-like protein A [Phytophthora ramorum]